VFAEDFRAKILFLVQELTICMADAEWECRSASLILRNTPAHDIGFTAIHNQLLIQVGQLSVTGMQKYT